MDRLRVFLLGALTASTLLLVEACGPATEFTDIWVAPDAQPFRAEKVLAVFISADPSLRRTGENELVRQISQRTPAVASYTFLDENQVKDAEYARQQVERREFDGVVIMRVLGKEGQEQYVPGTRVKAPYPDVYSTTWGYWRYAWPAVYEPDYAQRSSYIQMETIVYSVRRAELLWVGRSETVDPASVTNLVRDVSEATRDVLERQGLLNAP